MMTFMMFSAVMMMFIIVRDHGFNVMFSSVVVFEMILLTRLYRLLKGQKGLKRGVFRGV